MGSMMPNNEVELVQQETMTKEEIMGALSRAGLSPSVIGKATGVPTSIVKTIVRRRSVQTLPDDPQVQEAWKEIEIEAIDHIKRTIRFGAQNDRMALLKIIAGRALSRRGGETSEQFEEMKMAWNEIREEQSRIPESAETIHNSWEDGNDDGDEEDEWPST